MTQPRFASSDESKARTYTLPGWSCEVPSVTSVLGILHKPALVPWAAKLAAERAMRDEATWHSIQEEEGEDKARKWISAASREYTKYKQLLGSAVHWACENHGQHDDDDYKGKLDWFCREMGGDYDKNLKAVMSHYRQYVQFLEDNDVEIIDQERTVGSLFHGYAGTLDMIVKMHGKVYIGDIKTSKKIYRQTGLQLVAYLNSDHMVDGDRTVPFDMRKEYGVDGAFVLRLGPRSYKVQEISVSDREMDVFLAAMKLYEWEHLPESDILLTGVV